MTDFTKHPEEMPKKLTGRNWLLNAAITVTSLVLLLLFFTGCRKESNTPGGGVGGVQDQWYVLKVTYQDEKGVTKVGYLAGISAEPAFSFHDYMQISASGWKFKMQTAPNGFSYWQFGEDNYYLSLKYDGWAYRSYEANRIGWKIVNGKLYSDYDRWKDYPLGCQYRWDLDIIPAAYYVGVNLSNKNEFTCELVAAP
jgi:hypothetical protein